MKFKRIFNLGKNKHKILEGLIYFYIFQDFTNVPLCSKFFTEKWFPYLNFLSYNISIQKPPT